MKVTIIDNEIYLAQSISSKLNRHGFETELFTTYAQALKGSNGDIYLVSNNIPREKSTHLIKKFKDKIIILMVSVYHSMNIKKALSYGVNDYILKPFHLDELVRKIKHYQDFFNVKATINTYQSYLQHSFRDVMLPKKVNFLTFPLVIYSRSSIYVDKLILEYIQEKNQLFVFIPIMQGEWKKKIKSTTSSTLIYVKNVHYLSTKESRELMKLLKGKKFILSTTVPIESEYKTITIDRESRHYDGHEIMNIETYIQFVILKYQYQFPDTVLSKKLGFSRKSLHERRVKYNIRKQKTKAKTTKKKDGSMTKKLFLLIGAPGSGKTTDASIIAKRHKGSIVHYSTGDMLREEVQNGTQLGNTINEFIKKGALVPLDIIMNTIITAIKNAPTEIVLIDGYPRSVEQMDELDKVLKKEKGIELVSVIEVRVSEEVAKNRILGRAAEAITVRSDDNMEVFQDRMKVYHESLAEIQEFYSKKNLLKVCDGEKTVDVVVSLMENFILIRV